MNRQHRRITLWFSCLLLYVSTTKLQAAPITISAGFASVDQSTHQHVFREAVQIDEIHQHLRASHVEITTDIHNQILSAIARGSKNTPAHLWSTEKKPTLHAYANEIQYFPQEHRVVLSGNARLSQGKNSFSAPKITYNTVTQHIVSEAQAHQRTTIILDETHDSLIR